MMLYVNFVNVLITKDVILVMLMTINGCVSIVLVVYFRLIIILDDIEFRYSLNGRQLAKMKKSIPDMSLPKNL